MECPICKSAFSKVKEVLIMADRTFYCPHCWSRLISYPHGEEPYSIEEDITGEKWKNIDRHLTPQRKTRLSL
jgi:hypothetical protein